MKIEISLYGEFVTPVIASSIRQMLNQQLPLDVTFEVVTCQDRRPGASYVITDGFSVVAIGDYGGVRIFDGHVRTKRLVDRVVSILGKVKDSII